MQENPKSPQIEKEAPKTTSPEALPSPEVIRDVVFEEKRDKKGVVTKVRSSAMGRKEYILDPASFGLLDELGKRYSVKIVRDTNPDDPTKGSYVVEIVPEGSPQETKKSPSKWHKLEDVKGLLKLTSILNRDPHNYEEAIEMIRSLKLSVQALSSPEIQKAARNAFQSALTIENSFAAAKIRDAFRLAPDAIRPLIESSVGELVVKGRTLTLEGHKKNLGLSKDFFHSSTIQTAAIKGIARQISTGDVNKALLLKNVTAVPDEALSAPVIHEAVKEGFAYILKFGNTEALQKLSKSFSVPKEVMREAYIQGIVDLLDSQYYDSATQLASAEYLKEYKSSPKVKAAALKALESVVKHRDTYNAVSIAKAFALSQEEVSKTVMKGLPAVIAEGDYSTVEAFERDFKVSVSNLNMSEVQSSALAGVVKSLGRGWLHDALEYKKHFKLSDGLLAATPAVTKAAAEMMSSFIRNYDYHEAREMRKNFPVDEKALQELCKSTLVSLLRYGEYPRAKRLIEEMKIPKEVLDSPEVRGYVEKKIRDHLERGHLGEAVRLKEAFNVPVDTAEIRRGARALMDHYLRGDYFGDAVALQRNFPLSEKDFEEFLQKRVTDYITRGDFSYIGRYKEIFKLPDSFFTTPAIIEVLRSRFFDRLTRNVRVNEIVNLNILPADTIYEEAKRALERVLDRGNSPQIVLSLGVLKEEDLHSPELTTYAQHAILARLMREETNVDEFLQFDIPGSFFKEEETLRYAEGAFRGNLKRGYWTLDELKLFPIRERVLSSPKETIENFIEGAIFNLVQRHEDADALINDWFPLIAKELWNSSTVPEDVLQDIFSIALDQRIQEGRNFDDLVKRLPKDVLEAPERQGAIKAYLIDRLGQGIVVRKDFLTLASKDTISSSEVQAAAERGLMVVLERLAEKEKQEGTDDEDNIDANASTKYVMERYPLPPDMRRIVEMTREVFGSTFSLEQFTLIKAGERGENLPADFVAKLQGTELEKLKPKEIIPALKEMVALFRKSLLNDTPNTELLKVPFFQDMMRSMVRADVVVWGRRYTFTDMLRAYIQRVEAGETYPLPEGYTSASVKIKKIERDEPPKFTEAFTSKYGSLKNDLEEALGLVEYEKKPFSVLAKQVTELRDKLIPELAEKLKKIENPKGREHLERSLDALKALNPRSVKDFEKNFALLSNYKEFEPLMRQAVFLKSLHKHASLRDDARELVEREDPTFDDITWMTNYMTQVTHRDTWQEYFKDKQALKAFKGITNTNALTEELARFEQLKNNNTMPIDFIPSRGLLFEFSGELADACWMAKELNAAKAHPNKCSITMVANRGTPNERLIGACILMESKAQNGDDVIIIRGLNPIENIINQLSVEDFMEKFGEYVKGIAGRRGRKATMIIDSKSAACTNRQLIYDQMAKMRPKLKKAPLASERETTFNGYNVVDYTYYI